MRSITIFCLLMFILVVDSSFASSSLEIEMIDSIDRADASLHDFVIVIRSLELSRNVSDVRCSLWVGGHADFNRRSAGLAPGEVLIYRPRVRNPQNVGYLMVSYKLGHLSLSESRVFRISHPSALAGMPQILVPLVGLIGVVSGSILTSHLTTKRDRERSRQDWARQNFDKYEPVYREFLRNWAGIPQVVLLRENYEILASNAWVPVLIREQYENALTVLRAKDSTPHARQDACQALLKALDHYRLEPWKN